MTLSSLLSEHPSLERDPQGTVSSPVGFLAGAAACGLKKGGDLDVALLFSNTNCTAAGMFTRNRVAAAPVQLDREVLATGSESICAVVANSGCANACTGRKGLKVARAIQLAAAELLALHPHQVLLLSTGVIGTHLPIEKLKPGVKLAASRLSAQGGLEAARAIMTTDTCPKHVSISVNMPGGRITVGGIAKGAGMIHPEMATMLAVLTTDAKVSQSNLTRILKSVVDQSFNRISVDGDTSTNDTVLLLANGCSTVNVDTADELALFSQVLGLVCIELAQRIVRDGEGATRFVEIKVRGAGGNKQARRVAVTIAKSTLFKTAVAGGDPNWGRILAAAGRSDVVFDPDRVSLWIANPGSEPLKLVAHGVPIPYSEDEAAAVFAGSDILLQLDLGGSEGTAVYWTSDLTQEYVAINAHYRT